MSICPICTDHLSTCTIGTTVPCGHVFHKKCYEQWASFNKEANRRSSNGRENRAKCPNCNKFVDRFMNIYVNFEEEGGASDEEDDCSSCDSEVVVEGSDEEEDQKEYVESIMREKPQVVPGPEIIDVDAEIDLTGTDYTATKQSSSSRATAPTLSDAKLHKKVKKLKKRLKMVKTLAQDAVKANRENSNALEELEKVNGALEETKLELENKMIKCSRMERQVNEINADMSFGRNEVRTLRQNVQSLESQLFRVKAEAQERLLDARTDSRAELLEIGEQRKSTQQRLRESEERSKKLEEENKYLNSILKRPSSRSQKAPATPKELSHKERIRLYQEVKQKSELEMKREAERRRKVEKQQAKNQMMSTMSLKTRQLAQTAKRKIQINKKRKSPSIHLNGMDEEVDTTFSTRLCPSSIRPRHQGGKGRPSFANNSSSSSSSSRQANMPSISRASMSSMLQRRPKARQEKMSSFVKKF